MRWLNYHHLLYFWMTVREGSVLRASRALLLRQPTVSGQIRALEEALGEKLFDRIGKRLVLTEVGQLVFRYADEIFSLGQELQDALKGRPTGRPVRLMVGLGDAIPKLIAYRLLEPALTGSEPAHLVCQEDKPDRLLADLAVHALDLVLADAPLEAGSNVRAFSHLLGECGVTLFARANLARQLAGAFPRSLQGAPVLLPTANSTLRRSLGAWLEAQQLEPRIVGEFQDSALLTVFGQQGLGVFPAPSAVEPEVLSHPGIAIVGRLPSVKARFYALTAERRLKHPAVTRIVDRARTELFGAETAPPAPPGR